METFKLQDVELSFDKKYYIIQGNNGNHTGYNRQWVINAEGYQTKVEANKIYKEMVNDNGDIKYGLTPLKICTPKELVEIYESSERITFYNCFDITVND